jgi:hypothetical protein
VSDGSFLGYIALLAVSGILLAVLGIGGFGQSTGARIIDGLFAAVFLGYAGYLLFVFDGGEVRIMFYAFIVPILAVVQVFKARKASREAAAAPAYATEPAAPAPQSQAPQQ